MTLPWTIADVPGQAGRTAVVTGANGGLGLETALALAGRGAHVVMAVRDRRKAAAAVDIVRRTHPEASLELVSIDLADQATVKEASRAIVESHPVVDLLVNNAGLMATPDRRTADGYEMQFGVNHLGHWTLTAGLLPALLRSARRRRRPRVVTVTSMARFTARPPDPADPHLRRGYDAWAAYGQAKRSNFLFGLGLQDRFERAGVAAASLVAHPGLTHTGLQSRTAAAGGVGGFGRVLASATTCVGMAATDGALPQLRAATDPAARGGQLYAPRYGMAGPPVRRAVIRSSRTDAYVATLWGLSEHETSVQLDVERVAGEIDREVVLG